MIKTSLIIPTYNRCLILEKLLVSIVKQKTNQAFEVIVIDNGSTDNTKLICKNYAEQIGNLIYIYDDEPGLLTGRHRGASEATGEILCFLDDDVTLNPNYVDAVCKLFTGELHLATGPCLPAYEIEPPAWLNYFWDSVPEGKHCSWLSLLDFGNDKKNVSPNYVWGLNFCVRKETLISLDGFHPDCIPKNLQHFQGDGETGLTQKAIKAGMIAIYDPNLLVIHHVSKDRLTIEYFKKRAFYQGVCDSFTHLRNEQRNIDVQSKPIKSSLRDKLHPYYRWIKKIFQKSNKIPSDILKLKELIKESFKQGYQFHNHSFDTNEKVRGWVLKENYWNYKLPKND